MWRHKNRCRLFNVLYLFLSVGLFLLFVLEAGKTMVQSYEQFFKEMAEREALKHTKKQAAAGDPSMSDDRPLA